MKLLLKVLFLLLSLSVKSQGESYITHEGMKYTLFVHNDKLPLPQIGDYIRMRLVKFDPNGKEVFNTDYFGDPYGVYVELVPPKYTGDVMEIFALMHNGDSAYVKVPANWIEPSASWSDSDFYSYKLYLNIFLPKDIYHEMKMDMKVSQMQEDSSIIAKYLLQNHIKRYYIDSSGVVIIKHKKVCLKNYPQTGRNICVHYKGTVLHGDIFDDSFSRGSPLCFTTLSNQVIEGWDIGLRYFHPGEKGAIVIPSFYGYGDRGNGNDIPPNAILYFEIEVMK